MIEVGKQWSAQTVCRGKYTGLLSASPPLQTHCEQPTAFQDGRLKDVQRVCTVCQTHTSPDGVPFVAQVCAAHWHFTPTQPPKAAVPVSMPQSSKGLQHSWHGRMQGKVQIRLKACRTLDPRLFVWTAALNPKEAQSNSANHTRHVRLLCDVRSLTDRHPLTIFSQQHGPRSHPDGVEAQFGCGKLVSRQRTSCCRQEQSACSEWRVAHDSARSQAEEVNKKQKSDNQPGACVQLSKKPSQKGAAHTW